MGLENIANDTVMDAKDRNFLEILHIRERTAGLAYKLFEFYADRNKTIPDTIKKWQDICQSDKEFSEIRNQWITDH